MAARRANHKTNAPRSGREMSCRGFAGDRSEPREALPPTSRFRMHDDEDDGEIVGRASTLRLSRASR